MQVGFGSAFGPCLVVLMMGNSALTRRDRKRRDMVHSDLERRTCIEVLEIQVK